MTLPFGENASLAGLFSARPAADAARVGRFFFATDTGVLYRDTGSAWEVCGRAAAPITDHGALGGLADNDHPLYALARADQPPASPAALDDEFDADSSGAYTDVNFSAVTRSFAQSHVILAASTASGDNVRAMLKSAPATPYQVAGKVTGVFNFGTNGCINALLLRESGTGKLYAFGPGYDGGNHLLLWRFNSPTQYASEAIRRTIGGWPLSLYLRVDDDGTNVKFLASATGITGTWQQFFSESRTAFMAGAPNQIGVGFYHQSNMSVTFAWDWFRKIG